MLKPPKYSIVLSLDKSIRQHIGFLLKATDCAACIDSSVGQFRLQSKAHQQTHTHTKSHTQSPWLARSFSFSASHLAERKILKVRTGIRPGITQCNKKRVASKMERELRRRNRERKRQSKTGEQTCNEHPFRVLYPALSHSVIPAVFLIFSDKAKISAANLSLLYSFNPTENKQPHSGTPLPEADKSKHTR